MSSRGAHSRPSLRRRAGHGAVAVARWAAFWALYWTAAALVRVLDLGR